MAAPPDYQRSSSNSTSGDVSVSLTPSVDTPTRTVDGFTVSSSGRVNPGDTLEAAITAPSDQEYQIEIRDVKENIWSFTEVQSGDTTIQFDTANMPGNTNYPDKLEPGTYAVLPTDNGTLLDVAPFVVQAYESTTTVQDLLQSGTDLTVTADLTALPEASEVTIESVELAEWEDGGEGTTHTMTKVSDLEYETTLTDPPSSTFNVQTGVRKSVENSENTDSESIGISDSHTVVVERLDVQGASAVGGRPQYATPAVGTDRVFVGGLGSQVDALSKADVPSGASPVWSFDRAGSLADSSPAVAGGTVYVGSGGGVLYALSAGADSSPLEWRYPAGSPGSSALTSSPVVSDGVVYVGANDGTVRALSASDGSLSWTVDVGGPVYSRPAVGSSRVFVTTADGRLVAIDTANETVAWTYDGGSPFGASGPVVANNTVYVAADDVYAFDVGGTTPSWTGTEFGGTAGSTPMVHDGRVYAGSRDGFLYAFDTSGGSLDWNHDVGSKIAATPEVVDGRIVVAAVDGSLVDLDGSTGDLRTTEQLTDHLTVSEPVRSSPVVDGGTVFIGVGGSNPGDGQIVALDINRL